MLAGLTGIVAAIDTPARQSMLPELLDDRIDLPNAIALNSIAFHTGRMIGPSLAGIVIVTLGEAACFLLNAISYGALLAAIHALRLPQRPERVRSGVLDELREGVSYAWNFIPVRMLLFVLAMVSFMATPYLTLLPVVAARLFEGGADKFGYLTGAAGLGALLGLVKLALSRSVQGLTGTLVYSTAAAGMFLMLFSWSQWFWLSLLLLAGVGFSIVTTSAGINTVFQTIIDDDKRGRVMSLYTVAFLGVAPLGALAAGMLADVIGARLTLFIGGGFCVLGAVALARNFETLERHIRPVYLRLGIIRE